MKDKIRSRILAKRKNVINREEREDRLIDDYLMTSNASSVMLYYPTKDEVDVFPLVSYLLAEGKDVILPRVEGTIIVPVQITEETVYTRTEMGLIEPEGNIYLRDIDEVIVPAVAMTKSGDRVGYGGGFYDKFLSRRDCKTTSLMFKEQIVRRIKTEEHDIKIDNVLIG